MDSSSLDAVNTLSALTNLQQMDKTIAVRVGVRVRPFSSKEISASSSCESVLKCIREGTQEIRLGTRRFTYDAVFDESVTQEALYQSVAGPLMLNFLEGFNATVRMYPVSYELFNRKILDISHHFYTHTPDHGLWTDRFGQDIHHGKRSTRRYRDFFTNWYYSEIHERFVCKFTDTKGGLGLCQQ